MESELISFSCYSFFNWAGYREFLMECPVYLLFNEESYFGFLIRFFFFFWFFFLFARSKKNFSLRDFRKVLRFILFIGGEYEIVVKEKRKKLEEFNVKKCASELSIPRIECLCNARYYLLKFNKSFSNYRDNFS